MPFTSVAGSLWSAGFINAGRPGPVEKALHEHEIEPAIELAADLTEVGDLLESEALMQSEGTRIVGIDAGNQDMFAQSASPGNKRFDQ
jgi:hypothetical protein